LTNQETPLSRGGKEEIRGEENYLSKLVGLKKNQENESETAQDEILVQPLKGSRTGEKGDRGAQGRVRGANSDVTRCR